jgi:hypothetical protein
MEDTYITLAFGLLNIVLDHYCKRDDSKTNRYIRIAIDLLLIALRIYFKE